VETVYNNVIVIVIHALSTNENGPLKTQKRTKK